MKYFLDSNTLIEAKNRYYGMRICPAYWQWLLLQSQAFSLASIEPVKDELTKGHDELAAWAIDNSSFFWGVSDEDTQTAFVKVVTLVAQAQGMKTGAMEEFLRGADPWLIAKARPLELLSLPMKYAIWMQGGNSSSPTSVNSSTSLT
ncbi:hypothetical protein ALQ76_04440 [Pseudomonas syringae pv. atrofaciens]|uniref:DUF4411 family protein n=1 Tax=Pseudomonas syringae pv. lapsa TaxID=199201 RepID=A0AB74A9K2_PSESX|nr:hypothetical protein ALO39_101766 [Pseudomonas syringae pv. lapsa]RML18297.1 hypothetical protein ALQ99_101647 [Pseudomonas syringae pv. lapsa]RML27388.1 hypothetical protein ALQ98_101435 [Pseudomonas syringae pv. lapsa]RMM58023.1 hypothetical protein ALQ76_04440 [Pseudomonas syringae pv. atrofaciens]